MQDYACMYPGARQDSSFVAFPMRVKRVRDIPSSPAPENRWDLTEYYV